MLRDDIKILARLKKDHPEDYNLQIAMCDKIIGEILEEVIHSSPEDAYSKTLLESLKTFYLEKGDTYFKKGDDQLAIEEFTRVINNPNENYIKAYFERGRAHECQGHLDLAEADYRSVLELVEEGSRRDVEAALQHVICLKQESALELSILQNEEDYESAVKDFTKTIDHYEMVFLIRAYTKQAYIKRALAYEHQGYFDLAEVDYNKALHLEENNSTQKSDIEKALQRVRKMQTLGRANQEGITQRIVKLEHIISQSPKTARTYVDLAYLLRGKGHYDRAFDLLNVAITLDPENPLAYNNRGAIYEELKKFRLAERDYKRALQYDPQQPIIEANLSRVQAIITSYETSVFCLLPASSKFSIWSKARANKLDNVKLSREVVNFKSRKAAHPELSGAQIRALTASAYVWILMGKQWVNNLFEDAYRHLTRGKNNSHRPLAMAEEDLKWNCITAYMQIAACLLDLYDETYAIYAPSRPSTSEGISLSRASVELVAKMTPITQLLSLNLSENAQARIKPSLTRQEKDKKTRELQEKHKARLVN